MQASLAELWIYPIKGCAGQSLLTAQALTSGLMHDRSMMLVDAQTGRFVTQRTHPSMALIEPRLDGDILSIRQSGGPKTVFEVPFTSSARTVTVWRDTLLAHDLGDPLAQWFSAALGSSLRLVRFDLKQLRQTKRFAKGQPPSAHHFADGYPYLVLSRASLHALNERLIEAGSSAVGMDRFRPNIVIDEVDAHTEDFAASLGHASGSHLHMVSPCTRCNVPNINQTLATQSLDGQPSLALAQYRYDGAEDGITFGMNAQLDRSTQLAVGDVFSIQLDF